jgi:hypothetical protein
MRNKVGFGVFHLIDEYCRHLGVFD